MAERTKGKCKYCGKQYTGGYMGKHLQTCAARRKHLEAGIAAAAKEQAGYYLIKVYGTYNKEYWMYLEADEDLTLADLDQFLRDIWVECCGHLSDFIIHGMRFPNMAFKDWGDDEDTEMANVRLGDVLRPGLLMNYEYDFGTTSYLDLLVEDYRQGAPEEEPLTILSRNIAPKILCDHCKENPATMVNVMSYPGDECFFCDECMEELELDEEEFLPVCNSPRMGMCGYCGSDLYPDEFVPDTELAE